MGLMLPDLLRAEQAKKETSSTFGRAKSCIFCFMFGAPAHQDIWDLKPDSSEEVRGPFNPISTSVPGTQFGEHIPKIAGMAEAYYAQIAPHLYCGPIEGAANIQISACSPNFLILESIQTWGGFHTEILKKPIQWQDGYVIPPTEPGLGVELNEEVALAHSYTGTALHLEMADRPI